MNRTDLGGLALDIAEEYDGNLTLRQLYYQLVARGHIANSDRDYKRVGDVVAKARLAGDFPFEWLIDRGRHIRPGDFAEDHTDLDWLMTEAERYIEHIPRLARRSRWWGQKFHVNVWVEKEALAGVFEGPCEELGVSWFACRGYPSLSSLYAWIKQVAEDWQPHHEVVVVLYFGDHDPDGWQIPRSAEESIQAVMRVVGVEPFPVMFHRVALNMDQIEAYSPPPFPAKVTSSRFARYHEEHKTTDAWELDALRPEVLDQLIRNQVGALFDQDLYRRTRAEVQAARAALIANLDIEWFVRTRARRW